MVGRRRLPAQTSYPCQPVHLGGNQGNKPRGGWALDAAIKTLIAIGVGMLLAIVVHITMFGLPSN